MALIRLRAVDSGKVFSRAAKNVWVLNGGAVYVGLFGLPALLLSSPVAFTRSVESEDGSVALESPGGGGSVGPPELEDAEENWEGEDGAAASPCGECCVMYGGGSGMLCPAGSRGCGLIDTDGLEAGSAGGSPTFLGIYVLAEFLYAEARVEAGEARRRI